MPVEIDANRRCPRSACADQVWSKPEFLRELINEPSALREKIMEDERVTVAQEQDRTVRIRLDSGTAPLLADSANRDSLRAGFLGVQTGRRPTRSPLIWTSFHSATNSLRGAGGSDLPPILSAIACAASMHPSPDQ